MAKVKIVEQYYDIRPPVRMYRSVEVLLRYVPEEHLEGLRTITLTNSDYMRKAMKGKYTQEKRRFRAADCRGMYWGREIWLIVDQICDVELFMIIPPVRTIFLGEVCITKLVTTFTRWNSRDFEKRKRHSPMNARTG
jgi:hypothetical protein